LLVRTGRQRSVISPVKAVGPPQSTTLGALQVDAKAHYQALFRKLEWTHGPLDKETVTSIVGFSAGGLVSLSKLANKNIFVTCELSLYPEQKPSAEGLRFELLTIDSFDEDTCRVLLTALGNLSMNEQLGDGHTLDVRGVMKSAKPHEVKLKLFSESKIGNGRFGVYEVLQV
jgi:hypothetical protein